MNNVFAKKMALYVMVGCVASGALTAYGEMPTAAAPTTTTVATPSRSRGNAKMVDIVFKSLVGVGFLDGAYHVYNDCSRQTKVTALLTCLGLSAYLYSIRHSRNFKREHKTFSDALYAWFGAPILTLSFLNGIRTLISASYTGAIKAYQSLTDDTPTDDPFDLEEEASQGAAPSVPNAAEIPSPVINETERDTRVGTCNPDAGYPKPVASEFIQSNSVAAEPQVAATTNPTASPTPAIAAQA